MHRGADIGSDHHLVVTVMKVKLKNLARKTVNKVLHTGRLKRADVQLQISLELKNRFSQLESEHTGDEAGVEEEWSSVKKTVQTAAQKIVGFRRGTRKERWI